MNTVTVNIPEMGKEVLGFRNPQAVGYLQSEDSEKGGSI